EKSRARAPARGGPVHLPREPAVPRAREDWADHSHGPENRATREKAADSSSQGRRQVVLLGVQWAQAWPPGFQDAQVQPRGVVAQPEAGAVAPALQGRGLEVVDQGP